ncbi:GAF domain-containing sensor histidine kinase [Cellulophaga baltica]|uniref:sensor histidine kinase n=1 Tax=Cellulophaga TaxID=104264 RepID=UPI001C07D62C|nr:MULTISPECIES: GAF domain-containing sensor histidine kinase [Cellulophaga]MBU2996306.1 GAF domain-containing sensor histidine kinase [Cellulophaga baltica]MDO6767701.1 GAF domain-containing sensor histidine kinase [Cellulophaga sp. 1_MG-2023]
MVSPEIPENEVERIKALRSYNILDTLEEKEYDAITRIAAVICDAPMALVSLVDDERQWFKSHYGIDATETPREVAFCAHAINYPEDLFIVKDSKKDTRFFDNPLVTGGPKVQFYAGAPLNTNDGHTLGTLCVIDTKPRKEFTEQQKTSLRDLASQVVAQLEIRKQNINYEVINKRLENKNDQLKQLTYRLAHDLKTPLLGISSVVGFIKEDYTNLFKDTDVTEYLDIIQERASYMESSINGLINYNNVINTEVHMKSFNINDEISKIIEDTSQFKNIKFDSENCDVFIEHSLNSFIQIIQEFLTNSVKFSIKKEVEVKLTFEDSNRYYNFTFEDNSSGISKKYWNKVFVMFETIDIENNSNIGLGLARVKSIIEKLDGEISIGLKPDNTSGVFYSFKLAKDVIL